MTVPLPNRAGWNLQHAGSDSYRLHVSGGVAAPAVLPPNVRSFDVQGDTATIDVAPGTTLRMVRRNGALELAADKPGDAPAATPARRPPNRRTRAGRLAAAREAAAAARRDAAKAAQAAAAAASASVVTATAPAPGPATANAPAKPNEAAASAKSPPPAATAINGASPPAHAASGEAAEPPAPAPPPATPSAPATLIAPSPPAPLSSFALAARLQPDGHAIILPFLTTTGAAAFRRGDAAIIVFDERRPIDLHALRDDPLFGGATIQLLTTATVLHLPLPAGSAALPSRAPGGWVIAIGPPDPSLRPISPAIDGAQVTLADDTPSSVVVVPDDATGENLLVGTARQPGQGVTVARRTPTFTLLTSWLGVAVEPLSDSVTMRVAEAKDTDKDKQKAAFLLSSALPIPNGLALSASPTGTVAVAEAARLTRRFDFPDLPVEALLRREQAAVASAAIAPPLARLPPRRDAAQAMIALGLGAEAQSLLHLATIDDPRGLEDPDTNGLAAIAAMLAGRPDAADGIETPRLDGTDEVALWRAVHDAMRRQAAHDSEVGALDQGVATPPDYSAPAKVFARTLPLALAYPAAIRDRLLPLMAEAMVTGGQTKAAAAWLANSHDPQLDLARAMLAQANGDTAAALAGYDKVAAGADRLAAARAAIRAVELRLASKQITPAEAADADEKLFYAWRGDAREVRLRLRTAALRAEAGQWRQALALLREAETALPDNRALIHVSLVSTFSKMIHNDGLEHLAPMDLVALAQENADLVPEGEAGEAITARLADRLAGLDLPKRAAPLFDRLMRGGGSAALRGEFGARLAALRLDEGDAAGALDALSFSKADGLSPALSARRALLQARAEAANGAPAKAAATLSGLDTPDAEEARAAILERAQDWPAAEAALATYAARVVPADGKLDAAAAHVVLRWASAAAQAGDEATLARLRQADRDRLPDGSDREMFNVLTEPPVKGLADLPRAARETEAARALVAKH